MPGQQTLKYISLHLWVCYARRPQSLSLYFVLSVDCKYCPAWSWTTAHTSLVQLAKEFFLFVSHVSSFVSISKCFLRIKKISNFFCPFLLQMLNLILNWRTLPSTGSHWSETSFGSRYFSHLLGGGSRSNLSLKWLKGNNGDFAPCSAACFRPNQQWILTRSRWLCLKSAIWWTI